MINRNVVDADSLRTSRLIGKLRDESYRRAYMAQHLKTFLADQIRAIRGDRTQKDFGRLIDKPQSVVARFENEMYGKLSLQTLLDIAGKLDIALIVRFVDFPTFVELTSADSMASLVPKSYSQESESMGNLLKPRGERSAVLTLLAPAAEQGNAVAPSLASYSGQGSTTSRLSQLPNIATFSRGTRPQMGIGALQ